MPRTKTKLSFDDFIFARIPPQARDLEEVVLGALLTERDIYIRVAKFLRNDDVFYVEANREIFKAIKICLEKYNACDFLLVTDELRRLGNLEIVGGAYYVTELTNKVASTANVEYHSQILYEKFIGRKLIQAAMDITQKAYEDSDDIFITLDDAVKILDETQTDIASLKNVDFKKQISNTMKAIQEASRSKAIGYPTGMANVDAVTGGRVRGELTLIAARPSMGKTARMIQEAMNMAVGQETKVGVISLEMTHQQLIVRMLSNMSKINSQAIRAGRLTEHEWKNLVSSSGRLADTPFFLNDISNLTITDIRSIIRGWHKTEKVEIVFIDYIGLIKFQNLNGKPVDEIGKISRGLKTIAGECDMPIVALAQLNREVEKRGDKRPMLSDLRDSGTLEQDADVVSFLFRPEYYGIFQDESGQTTEGLCEENIAKNRNGMIGKTWHKYTKEINEFVHHSDTPLIVNVMKELPADNERVLAADELPWG